MLYANAYYRWFFLTLRDKCPKCKKPYIKRVREIRETYACGNKRCENYRTNNQWDEFFDNRWIMTRKPVEKPIMRIEKQTKKIQRQVAGLKRQIKKQSPCNSIACFLQSWWEQGHFIVHIPHTIHALSRYASYSHIVYIS